VNVNIWGRTGSSSGIVTTCDPGDAIPAPCNSDEQCVNTGGSYKCG